MKERPLPDVLKPENAQKKVNYCRMMEAVHYGTDKEQFYRCEREAWEKYLKLDPPPKIST